MAGGSSDAREAAGVLVRVLNLSTGQDTGGQQLRLLRAFRRHAQTWEYESVTAIRTFYEIARRYRALEVRSKLWPWADVVHLHGNVGIAAQFYRRGRQRRPLVIHHHGSLFRIGHEKHLAEAAAWKAEAIVSTLDLHAIAPEQTTWTPTPYDLALLASYRGEPRHDGVLRIAHAPTNRAVKSTDALIAAVKRLQADGAPVELDLIEGLDNLECLRRKGQADVYVDQVLLGIGCNALEAMGMGLPVIAGVDPELAPARMRQRIPADTRDVMLATWGSLPFYEATEATLYDALAAMLDRDTRALYAARGLAHVERWHDSAVVVPMMQAVYERAAKR